MSTAAALLTVLIWVTAKLAIMVSAGRDRRDSPA